MTKIPPLEDFMKAINEGKKFFLNQICYKQDHLKETEKIKEENELDPSNFSKNVHIYSHLDADGLSSAALIAITLKRLNLGYQISILPQLEPEYIEKIKNEISEYNNFIIFSDFGTGQVKFLEKELPSSNYLILDHHQPEILENSHEVFHINPYFYGISGEDEISGAGVCYLFAKIMDPKNKDLAFLAIIGAMGDIQNKGKNGMFYGVNKSILDDAINTGKISLNLDIAISRNLPLAKAIAYTLPENLSTLSQKEGKATTFLEDLQIRTTNEWNINRTLLDLSESEKKTLLNALIKEGLKRNNKSKDFVLKLVKQYYNLSGFEPIRDIQEMSRLLNACGRLDYPSLGIASLMGDKEALKQAIEKNKQYKKEISQGIYYAKENIRNYNNINTVYHNAINEKILGTICSILIHSDEELKLKPMIAFADSSNHSLKVSARADHELVKKKGLNLGIIMREVCKLLKMKNPSGGGHPPAAGAKIPSMNLKQFIEEVDNAVGIQLNTQLNKEKN